MWCWKPWIWIALLVACYVGMFWSCGLAHSAELELTWSAVTTDAEGSALPAGEHVWYEVLIRSWSKTSPPVWHRRYFPNGETIVTIVLPPGQHLLCVYAIRRDGTRSGPSDNYYVTIDGPTPPTKIHVIPLHRSVDNSR